MQAECVGETYNVNHTQTRVHRHPHLHGLEDVACNTHAAGAAVEIQLGRERAQVVLVEAQLRPAHLLRVHVVKRPERHTIHGALPAVTTHNTV